MIPPRFVRRKHAYARLFRHVEGSPVGDAREVLADLKRFAHLPDAPIARSGVSGMIDPIASAVLAGRQEVVNRILAQVHMDEAAFFKLREPCDD